MTFPNYQGTLFVYPNTVTNTGPGVTNDAGQGYQVGSRWLNTATGTEFVCTDTTPGAAVWAETTAGGGGAEAANLFLAGPATGSAAIPTFRAIVVSDVPTLNQGTTGNAATATDLAGTKAKNLVYSGPASGSNAAPTFRALVAADVTVDALQNLIADPGNAGAIPVTATGTVLLTTAGAETRTIAAPTAVGIELLLNFETKVGNCVVTVASTINATGNNTITFTTVGWSIKLVSVRTSVSAFRWAVEYTDGATLSTV